MESVSLIKTKNEFILISIIISLILAINLMYKYDKYKNLVKEEIYTDSFQVINIYKKNNFNLLKLTNKKFVFYTSINKSTNIKKLQNINLTFITLHIGFLDYLKSFYAKTLFINKINYNHTLKAKIYENMISTHKDIKIQEFYSALFMAIPISSELREVCTNYGISHLIAISGFHLALISFLIYCLVYFPYSFIQSRFFPYRNKKSDIVLVTIFILSIYLYFLDFIPSFLRSFVMFILGIYFLRSNIKVLSYENLFLTFVLIVSLFPSFLFSLSFWFSITAVFYIFLYIQYFKQIPKYISIIFFNFWIFLVFNPVVHYFFYNTSYEQLISPILTIIFIVFYPFVLLLHLTCYANLLDAYLIDFFSKTISFFEYQTPLWFFVVYILLSLYSVVNKRAFFVLNILLLLFNLYLYL